MQVEWGIDMSSEHERYLAERVFKSPVIVYNYPKDIKVCLLHHSPLGSALGILIQLLVVSCTPRYAKKTQCHEDVASDWPCAPRHWCQDRFDNAFRTTAFSFGRHKAAAFMLWGKTALVVILHGSAAMQLCSYLSIYCLIWYIAVRV